MMDLTVAAIQMESKNGDVAGNLDRAVSLVEQAAAQGATLICLPEFLPSGYIFAESAWEAAEPADGPTVKWLQGLASRLKVTIGTSFLEAVDGGFINTFVLMGPDREYGRVHKQEPALFENYFTEGRPGSHVIQTPIGRVGVGICYENMRAFLSRLLVEHDADILLQPHSCPGLPSHYPGPILRIFDGLIHQAPVRYAEGLGIPTVFTNKCGQFDTPLPTLPLIRHKAPFIGLTAIVDSDGKVLARAEREQAVLVATVHLDPGRKTGRPLPAHGYWAVKAPLVMRKFIDLTAGLGRSWYIRNKKKVAAYSQRFLRL